MTCLARARFTHARNSPPPLANWVIGNELHGHAREALIRVRRGPARWSPDRARRGSPDPAARARRGPDAVLPARTLATVLPSGDSRGIVDKKTKVVDRF